MGIHKYNKWQEIEMGQIVKTIYNRENGVVGRYMIQERVCENCNRKQLNTQRVYTVG